MNLDHFARAHHPLELGSVNSGRNRDRSIVGCELTQQDCTALQTAFAKDDARNQWEVWKMSLQEKLVR